MTTTAAADPITTVPKDVLVDLHRRMVRIRLFEEEAGKLMEGGKLPGFLHLYVGQEACAAGVMANLRDDDVITSTHRGHGHAVAKGADLKYMYAELFGKMQAVVDSVADKGIFHKNKASRDKSRLSAKVKALATAAA